MPLRLPPLTRRTALGATLVGLVAAAGCDLDDLDPRSEPAPPDEAAPSTPPEADALLAESVVVDLLALQVAIGQVRAGQRARFRPLARLHRRHLAELDGPAVGEGAPTSAAPTSVVSAASIIRSEQRLQRRLATAAIEAESGELAVVLASMSAAVAQQLAVLAPASGAR